MPTVVPDKVVPVEREREREREDGVFNDRQYSDHEYDEIASID